MNQKSFVYAFPKPKWIDTVSCDGKPCGKGGGGCGSNPATTSGGSCKSEACGDTQTCDFASMLEFFGRKYNDFVEVKVADYSSLKSILGSLDDLNAVLKANLEDMKITMDNLELIFSQIAPFVAINGTLAFVGKTPDEGELLDALQVYGAYPDSLTLHAKAI